MSLSVFTFTGRLGRNAELKEHNGNQYASFSAAYDVGYGDKKETVWVECTLWGKRAASIVQYLTKGKQVVVSGEAKPYVWQSENAPPRAGMRCKVGDLDFLGPREGGQGNAVPAAGSDEVPF